MKTRPNYIFFITILLILTTSSTYAEWQQVGEAKFTAGSAWNPSIVLDSNGTPYVSFSDGAQPGDRGIKVSVMCFDGNNWVYVGNPGFSASGADIPQLALDNNEMPYVVYSDRAYEMKTTVMRFDGTNWVYVGNPGFSPMWSDDNSLAFDSNGTPYVAYTDMTGNISVMRFNGTEWVYVGTPGFCSTSWYVVSLALDSADTPYVALESAVLRFDGMDWEYVSPSSGPVFGVFPHLVFDSNNTPYVAYEDRSNSSKGSVMHFNGTAWTLVGTPGFALSTHGWYSLAVNGSGTPYVVIADSSNDEKVSVMYFNGTDWAYLGTPGFSIGETWYPDIALDNNGTPYVAYKDGFGEGISVMRFVEEGKSRFRFLPFLPAILGAAQLDK